MWAILGLATGQSLRYSWQTYANRDSARVRAYGTQKRKDNRYYYEKRGRGSRCRICFARGDEAGGSESLQNRWAPAKQCSVLARINRRARVSIEHRLFWTLRLVSHQNNAAVSRTSVRFAGLLLPLPWQTQALRLNRLPCRRCERSAAPAAAARPMWAAFTGGA